MRPRAGLCSGAESASVSEQHSHDQHDSRELSVPLTPVMMTLVTMMMMIMFRPETEVLLQWLWHRHLLLLHRHRAPGPRHSQVSSEVSSRLFWPIWPILHSVTPSPLHVTQCKYRVHIFSHQYWSLVITTCHMWQHRSDDDNNDTCPVSGYSEWWWQVRLNCKQLEQQYIEHPSPGWSWWWREKKAMLNDPCTTTEAVMLLLIVSSKLGLRLLPSFQIRGPFIYKWPYC